MGIAFKFKMEGEEELVDEDLVLPTKKLKRFFNRNTNGRTGETSNWKASNLMCFYCRKLGHNEADCPLLNKENSRRKRNHVCNMEWARQKWKGRRLRRGGKKSFVALSNELQSQTQNLDNFLDQFDMHCCDESYCPILNKENSIRTRKSCVQHGMR